MARTAGQRRSGSGLRRGGGTSLCAAAEFSNLCRRNCRYCGLQRANRELRRYCLTPPQILAAARQAAAAGVDTLVLQSGEWERPPHWLASIVRQVKAELGLAVTLSVAKCRASTMSAGGRAGADRFLLRHETADAALYARLHPGHQLSERLRATLR